MISTLHKYKFFKSSEIIRNIKKGQGSLAKIFTLFVGAVSNAVFLFLAQIWLARILDVSNFGAFMSALALSTMISPVAGFGLQGFLLSRFGVEGWGARRWLSACYKFMVLSSLSAVMALFLWSNLGLNNEYMRYCLLLLIPIIPAQAMIDLASARFQLEERYTLLSVWQTSQSFMRIFSIAAIVFFVKSSFLLKCVPVGYASVAVLLMIFATPGLMGFTKDGFSLKGHGAPVGPIGEDAGASIGWLEVGRRAFPFGISGIFYLAYIQMASVLLNYLVGPHVVGSYSIAFSVISATYLLPMVIYQRFMLPKLYRWESHSPRQLALVTLIGVPLMGVIGFSVMGGLFVIGHPTIEWLLSDKYAQAWPYLKILGFCIPVRYASSAMSGALVNEYEMRRKSLVMSFAAIVNFMASITLIHIYGATGCAYAMLLTEFFLMMAFTLMFYRKYKRLN